MTADDPSAVLRCSRCGDEVELLGALSLAGDPFVCVECLDPRQRALPGEPVGAQGGYSPSEPMQAAMSL